jgi:hypothetical protein
MKNILTLTLLTTGLAISTMSSPANAGDDWKKKQDEAQAERAYQQDVKSNREEFDRNQKEKGKYAPTPSNNDSGSGFGGAIGAIFGLFNYGPSVLSSNGVLQYGVQAKFGFDRIRVRTGGHFGGGGQSTNGGFTYGFGGSGAMFNPFIGGGFGHKSITPANSKTTSNVFALYSTAGLDIKLGDTFTVTGSVNLPTNGAYGTEYQAGVNFFKEQF